MRQPTRYALLLDLDPARLAAGHPAGSAETAAGDIARGLNDEGFRRWQDGLWAGDDGVDAVRCVLAVQTLAARHPWFTEAVNDIRMLRIAETSDLRPAIDLNVGLKAG